MILVTGATGKVGRSVVDQLVARGVAVRAMSRNPATAALPPKVDVIEGDAGDAEQLVAALRGIRAVFFLGPDTLLPQQAEVVARVARASGVEHIVMVSSLSVEMEDGNPLALEHQHAERAIMASGCAWTMLRAGQFASNTLMWAPSIRSEGTVRCLWRNDPVASVDPVDIGKVAAEVLTSSGHEGKCYGLTGGEAITPEAQTAILAELLERPLKFVALNDAEAHEMFVPRHVDRAEGEAKLRAIRRPDVPWNAVRHCVRDLTGVKAATYRMWAERNIGKFKGAR